MFNTPILFIVFNRPGVTAISFDRIRELKPPRLFIAADGPRKENWNDEIKCKETRDIVGKVDWDCEVKTLFRSENLGCGKGVSLAITWFFEHVEQGIILEDDCLPDLTFFNYCQELLEYYKNSPSVFHIGGVNFQNKQRGDHSYYFSALTHVWGWATWRRAWQHYDFDVKDLDVFVKEKKATRYFDNKILARYWEGIYRQMNRHEIDTWDNQWNYAIQNQGGVSIVPNVNLVSNIGFGINATHTVNENQYAELPVSPINLPLSHPNELKIDREADHFFYDTVEGFFKHYRENRTTLFFALKRNVLIAIEKLLEYFVFRHKIRNPEKRILIAKTDALGDYILARNFIEELMSDPQYSGHSFYLLASSRLKRLIESTDKHLYKDIIYFEADVTKKFKTLYSFYFKLRAFKFGTIIYPVYSRSRQIDDIIYHVGAPKVVGFKGDTANQATLDKKITDGYFTELIDVDVLSEDPLAHEFIKQKSFFETLLGRSLGIQKPLLGPRATEAISTVISLCPGAQEKSRTWSTQNFNTLIRMLHGHDNSLKFNLITGPGEEALFKQIQDDLPVILNHINNVDFKTLFRVLKSSKLVICNDSAPAHFAVALEVNSVCISNGNHYGRFVPYPQQLNAKQKVVFPAALLDLIQDHSKFGFFYKGSTLEINSITPQEVFKASISTSHAH